MMLPLFVVSTQKIPDLVCRDAKIASTQSSCLRVAASVCSSLRVSVRSGCSFLLACLRDLACKELLGTGCFLKTKKTKRWVGRRLLGAAQQLWATMCSNIEHRCWPSCCLDRAWLWTCVPPVLGPYQRHLYVKGTTWMSTFLGGSTRGFL